MRSTLVLEIGVAILAAILTCVIFAAAARAPNQQLRAERLLLNAQRAQVGVAPMQPKVKLDASAVCDQPLMAATSLVSRKITAAAAKVGAQITGLSIKPKTPDLETRGAAPRIAVADIQFTVTTSSQSIVPLLTGVLGEGTQIFADQAELTPAQNGGVELSFVGRLVCSTRR
jgi:hypothetical protein